MSIAFCCVINLIFPGYPTLSEYKPREIVTGLVRCNLKGTGEISSQGGRNFSRSKVAKSKEANFSKWALVSRKMLLSSSGTAIALRLSLGLFYGSNCTRAAVMLGIELLRQLKKPLLTDSALKNQENKTQTK